MVHRDACPICLGHAASTVWTGRGATARVCGQCGFAFLAERTSEAEAETRRTYERIYARPALENELTAMSYKTVLGHFERYRRIGSIVDVGCGSGAFLSAAARAGWLAIGTEIARSAADIALPPGASMVVGEDATSRLSDGSADVVTAWEVVEHVDDPVALLAEARRIARVGGLVYLTTPNHASLSRRLLGARWPRYHIEHTGYFDPRTIERALTLAGLVPTRIATRTFDPFTVIRAFRRGGAGGTADVRSNGATRITNESEGLRSFLKRGRAGRMIYRSVNAALCATALGDTVVAEAERRR